MSGRLQIITFIGTHLISGDDRWEGWSHLCPSCRAQVWELILEVFMCVFCALMVAVVVVVVWSQCSY
jgi:hypothetical protein